jgi:DNA-binding NarL/FixJ family response regulator
MKARILLVDDHKMMRDGLRALIEKHTGMEVVGEAADGRTAIQCVQELNPDVVVMDITMPDMNGMAATRQIIRERSRAKVLILSMHADRRFVAETLGAGAAGYLLKDGAFEELVLAIRTVVAGKTYLSPDIAGLMVDEYKQRLSSAKPAVVPVLSAREREVLQLLAEGQSTKQIAAELGVSVKTIETHRQQIMTKLNLDSIAELTKYAVREGLTSI